jgi:hypothetical protein
MMKKERLKLMAVSMIALLTACTTADPVESKNQDDTVDVTFRLNSEAWSYQQEPMRTRALTADGKQMTDIWILDYVGTELKQQLHQASTDDDFGSPTLSLTVGSHNIYFVASRGQNPTLDTDAKTLTFTKVLDTFYKHLALEVQPTNSGAQAVSLSRIVTKLKLTFTDAIPTGAATFDVTPSQWHYGINYTTGQPTAATASQAITANIPASAIGSTGEVLNIFGFSATDEWTTDVAIACKDGESNVLSTVAITDAPFKCNRVTSYTGPLFSSNGALTLSLNTDWDTEYTATW